MSEISTFSISLQKELVRSRKVSWRVHFADKADHAEAFGLQGPEAYIYTSRSRCLDVRSISDESDFQETLVSIYTVSSER